FAALLICLSIVFFFSSRRRHTRSKRDWSSDVCSSDLGGAPGRTPGPPLPRGAPAPRHVRGTTRLWFSPAVDRIGDNSADDWGLCALAVDNRGSAVDGRWGGAGRSSSGVRMLTAIPRPCDQVERRSTLLAHRLRLPLDESMTCGDAGSHGVAERWSSDAVGLRSPSHAW